MVLIHYHLLKQVHIDHFIEFGDDYSFIAPRREKLTIKESDS